MALSTCAASRSAAVSDDRGPSTVSSAKGSPTFAPVMAVVNFSTNASYRPSTTMKRLATLHDWPVLSRRALTAACTAASRSSVDSRMNRDGGAGTFRPGDRHALHARIGDDRGRLIVGRVRVDA